MFLQTSGRAGFLIRAALAATLSGLWGVYSGFELCEAAPLPGREEYLDSEKYQIRAWDWQRPGNIVGEIAALNRIRRAQPGAAFASAASRSCPATTTRSCSTRRRPRPATTCWWSRSASIRAIAQAADVELPLWKFGLPDGGTLEVEDLLAETAADVARKMAAGRALAAASLRHLAVCAAA